MAAKMAPNMKSGNAPHGFSFIRRPLHVKRPLGLRLYVALGVARSRYVKKTLSHKIQYGGNPRWRPKSVFLLENVDYSPVKICNMSLMMSDVQSCTICSHCCGFQRFAIRNFVTTVIRNRPTVHFAKGESRMTS